MAEARRASWEAGGEAGGHGHTGQRMGEKLSVVEAVGAADMAALWYRRDDARVRRLHRAMWLVAQ